MKLFHNINNFTKYVIGLPIIFIFVTAFIIGTVIINHHNQYYMNEIKDMQKKFIDEEKEKLYKNATIVNNRIDVMYEHMIIATKKRLKVKINVGYTIANELYNQYKDTKTHDEIKKMITTALSKISWDHGKSYFKIATIDPSDKDAIIEELNILKKDNDGYIHQLSIDSNLSENDHITYIKKIGFYNWYIATTEYISANIIITKDELKYRLKKVNFNDNNSYLFILELLNIDGGDKFARMIVNPNRPDLIGKYLNDSYKDIKGKEFRKDVLAQIKKQDYAWVEYWYKKPNGDIAKKLSYFSYNKRFNWIIGNGFYIDDIQKEIDKYIEIKQQAINKEILDIITITIVLVIFLSIFSVLLSRRIHQIINLYSQRLKNINKTLSHKVVSKVDELRKKDDMLIQQSRSAAMGEMIGNIAHQWRQPLNVLSVRNITLYTHYQQGNLTDNIMEAYIENSTKTLQHMSNTIDDFRNFFKKDKIKEDFNVTEIIEKSFDIINDALINNNIVYNILSNSKTIMINGYKSEFSQVILNILTNSKDAIKSKKIDSGRIQVKIFEKTNQIIISIEDNAGGISNDIIPKIFDPYFTTKHQSEGTGIGLYMSKMIIEKNMGGHITVENGEDGAIFKIIFESKLKKDNDD